MFELFFYEIYHVILKCSLFGKYLSLLLSSMEVYSSSLISFDNCLKMRAISCLKLYLFAECATYFCILYLCFVSSFLQSYRGGGVLKNKH